MADLLYYREENERQPEMHAARCSPEEAVAAMARLDRHFLKVRKPWFTRVEFTSGNRMSRQEGQTITLNVQGLSWLLVAHEFAHRWHGQRVQLQIRKLSERHPFGVTRPPGVAKRIERLRRQRAHGRHHARLVDRVCAYIAAKGWDKGELAHPIALKLHRERTREARAACPPPIDARIAHREAQVKRLETKIRGLTTRLKKAKRSLGALQRSAPRRTP